jgi:hypothetical protein
MNMKNHKQFAYIYATRERITLPAYSIGQLLDNGATDEDAVHGYTHRLLIRWGCMEFVRYVRMVTVEAVQAAGKGINFG